MNKINEIRIGGFKSIQEQIIELNDINIIIGANGAGKSNLLAALNLVKSYVNETLDEFVINNGYADGLLYEGPKITKKICIEFISSDGKGLSISFTPTPHSTLHPQSKLEIISEMYRVSRDRFSYFTSMTNAEPGTLKENIPTIKEREKEKEYLENYNIIRNWQQYHFHDTSNTSGMRRYNIVQDNSYLRTNGDNIAPFLLKLKTKYPNEYQSIINNIRIAIPFFDDFLLEVRQSMQGMKEEVNLSWKQKGSDYPMQPYQFSDGSIRFICLVVALLQPNPPHTIIIDEPELGLHPSAISLLGELIQYASKHSQIIIATQSPELINHFSINDIIVAKNSEGQSIFERLDEKDFSVWLEDYLIGELWTKNIIQAGVIYE